MNKAARSIVLLEKHHDRTSFDCGVEPLNRYIQRYALQNQRKDVVRNYVVAVEDKVIAYYALSFGSVAPEIMPPTMRSGGYLIPIMLIGRLAVDLRHKGEGLGHALLQDAALRALQAASIAGLKALYVHAKGEDAKTFYLHHGFIPALGDPFHLFFPLVSAIKLQ